VKHTGKRHGRSQFIGLLPLRSQSESRRGPLPPVEISRISSSGLHIWYQAAKCPEFRIQNPKNYFELWNIVFLQMVQSQLNSYLLLYSARTKSGRCLGRFQLKCAAFLHAWATPLRIFKLRRRACIVHAKHVCTQRGMRASYFCRHNQINWTFACGWWENGSSFIIKPIFKPWFSEASRLPTYRKIRKPLWRGKLLRTDIICVSTTTFVCERLNFAPTRSTPTAFALHLIYVWCTRNAHTWRILGLLEALHERSS